MSAQREETVRHIDEARQSGARQSKACEVMVISAKTYQRWGRPENRQDGRLQAKHEPANRLTELERQRMITLANEPEYADL
jgi:putative transposase